jgi:hypothetical protein
MKVELHDHPLWRQPVKVSAAADPPQQQNGVQVSLVRNTKSPLGTPIKQGFDDLLKFLAGHSQLILSCPAFAASLSLNDPDPLQMLESLREQ